MAETGSWQSAFRKRHATIFTKVHELRAFSPSNVKVYVVIERVDDGILYHWNSEGLGSSWPPDLAIPVAGRVLKPMGPTDILEENRRREEKRSKKAEAAEQRRQKTVADQRQTESDNLAVSLPAEWNDSPSSESSDVADQRASPRPRPSLEDLKTLFNDNWDYGLSADNTTFDLDNLVIPQEPIATTEQLTCDPRSVSITQPDMLFKESQMHCKGVTSVSTQQSPAAIQKHIKQAPMLNTEQLTNDPRAVSLTQESLARMGIEGSFGMGVGLPTYDLRGVSATRQGPDESRKHIKREASSPIDKEQKEIRSSPQKRRRSRLARTLSPLVWSTSPV